MVWQRESLVATRGGTLANYGIFPCAYNALRVHTCTTYSNFLKTSVYITAEW